LGSAAIRLEAHLDVSATPGRASEQDCSFREETPHASDLKKVRSQVKMRPVLLPRVIVAAFQTTLKPSRPFPRKLLRFERSKTKPR